MTEADFLTREAADAKKAISTVSCELLSGVSGALNPKPIIGKHPWMALGAAAVAGFVGGTMVTPSRQEAAIKKLETLSKALRAATGEKVSKAEAKVHNDESDKPQSQKEDSLLGMLLNHVIKPAITATIIAAVKPQSPPQPTGNGAAASGPAQEPTMG